MMAAKILMTIPFFAFGLAIYAPGARMWGFPKVLQISGGPGCDLFPNIVGESITIPDPNN